MAAPAKRHATYADLQDVPEGFIAELIDGELVTQPRPGLPHTVASSSLGEELGPPFKRGRGGPGGWVILDEPELHLSGNVLVPDLAGWRRQHLPEIPVAAAVTIAPDWVCEVLSPSSERTDRGKKLRLYATEGVLHVWFVNPTTQTLEVLALDGANYRILDVFEGNSAVRAVPFDAIELELGLLWAR